MGVRLTVVFAKKNIYILSIKNCKISYDTIGFRFGVIRLEIKRFSFPEKFLRRFATLLKIVVDGTGHSKISAT